MMLFLMIFSSVLVFWCMVRHWPLPAKKGNGLMGKIYHSSKNPKVITIGTYNIHRARGVDGTRNLGRIASVISSCDVVALQEVEGNSLRNFRNQAYSLADRCGYSAHFSATRRQLFFPHRGNALLSRFPVIEWIREPLSPTTGKAYRNVTTYKIRLQGKIINVINTHLSKPSEQTEPLKHVLNLFLSFDTAVLLGDFNTTSLDPNLQKLLTHKVRDATALSTDDVDRIDWILVRGLDVLSARMEPPGASDHPFFSATLSLRSSR
ncbi:MAG: hypothetical protein CL402_09870 [Acidiferrobacteraceae bacterium]|nr:hypothetical protein [Acidiferrobacteraceae bacterium]